ncbi:MAG: tRNA preQ1(34) S-adenosylmethionine ribosyltransferase-isomerase QueA [Thalassospira sp.]|jgi:S-adenosylmethionine:tRNA ribosyltransferase-isomerase|uniref:tRNA preQ1(34) S-adenosylmethionine ribosyltransferase-isomerase QueA n=1 Tax=Thalassospira sp. TaxID=1912094 RepID=UPI001B296D42|nr:tRNA preQ1(34) S-adenosylmethionine ribosyltransferase-isomerase QueA [Thalassospira sp.]MBO6580809.1 tRNA preQ1(34) S-adenosylmethionine ribosyltransferase-isomerase QueA [Thalassospira sp.]MBO6816953.1 tRNA preQ1(34) S-adenosylmethionine ribosyltransferase-isomerase QueA [Thalassospira sp.]MBO6886937.1 tRNA preQ1(34) S-adenosylmethionine ribosyltransferase-isomerase QueA [Thalassospira sp.]
MKVDLFDFELPRERIAEHPANPRDAARMLDLSGEGMQDRIVRELPDILRPGDLLISNDTRVIPARLFGKRGDAKVEVTLHKQEGLGTWVAFAKPAKKLRIGETFKVNDEFEAEVLAKKDGGEVTLRFNKSGADLIAALEKYGVMPLPPYIRRDAGGDDQDKSDYQTIFAQKDGAVAAPTAGLHFTPELLANLDARGINRRTITLHVGAGTFLPVKVDDTDDHKMHAEWGSISKEIADLINETRANGGRVVAVGTTSLRLLESAAREDGVVEPFEAETDIFITPGYKFRAVDMLLTNFHLPRSTLFMLVSAFAGFDRMKAAYQHAIDNEYRFYSYGDCSLLECANKIDART